jgi:hypothetical protein
MMSATLMQRTPLVISAGDLVVGPVRASFHDDDPASLLHNYLVAIRELRGQQRERRLTLRGEDISALAEHLGTTETTVLGDLLDLMGATRAQRHALFTLFAAGALTIVATGSVALNLPTSEVAAKPRDPIGIESSADVAVEPIAVRSTTDHETSSASIGPEVFPAATSTLLAAPLPVALLPAADAAIDLVEGVGIADDGSTVAVAPAPIPPVEGEGVADDGSIVAVAPPPVPAVAPGPAVEGEGVADDGSIVAVAPPPIP